MITKDRLFKRNPLAAKLTVLIILCSSMVTLVAIGFTLYKQYRDDISALDDRLRSIEAISLSSLSKSLWKYDDDQVLVIISGILALDDVTYVEVKARNWDGSERGLHVGSPPTGDSHLYRILSFPLTFAGGDSEKPQIEQLGELKVIASLSAVYDRLWEQAAFIVFTQLIKTLIITIVILWLVKSLLTRHLAHIADFIRSIKLTNPMPVLALKRQGNLPPHQDELDDVVHAMNQMTKNLLSQQQNEMHLLSARIKAEAANQAKSDFLATMSHEIRTPMNGVIGMIEVFETDNLRPAQQEQLAIIKQSSESLLTIINDILDFSRMEAGKLKLVNEHFDFYGLINDCVQLYGTVSRKKLLDFDVSIDPAVPDNIFGDSIRIRQILLNLLSNAFKFTDSGNISLTISLLKPAAKTSFVHISIRDTGCGIHEHDLEKLFMPFEQTTLGRKQGNHGTGLGLSICKQLVQLIGGEIGINSTNGTGSEFWFTIPLILSDTGNAPNNAAFSKLLAPGQFHTIAMQPVDVSSIDADVKKSSRYERYKVVVAEDNPVNRTVIVSMLSKFGIVPTVCHNGQEILELLIQSEESFDLILMDCEMPIINGYDATRLIRDWEREHGRPKIRIVALTAHFTTTHREKALEAGMDDYLSKPIKLGDVESVLKSAQAAA